MERKPKSENVDLATVEGFGAEWAAFDQSKLTGAEYEAFFDAYFGILPAGALIESSEGFDLGCGSGRWAARVAEKVGLLHCIDPSPEALAVAERRLGSRKNVQFHCAAADSIPLEDGSQDFGYSLGVLHHIPDTRAALADCARKLKPGAPLLVYLYYALDGRPAWFRLLWAATNQLRKFVSRLPFRARRGITDLIAAGIYWPIARVSRVAERLGMDISNMPLGAYRQASFYTMRTDALDRFGTRLEQRFTRTQIEAMMRDAGLYDIHFSDHEPYWVACGRRRPAP